MSTVVATKSRNRHQTYMAKVGEIQRKWLLVDATDRPLGRLAVRLATVLQGKHRPTWTPHVDTGDFVVVTNLAKVKLTGNKRETDVHTKWTEYPGGLREITQGQLMAKSPETVLRLAVRRMLPKGRMGKAMLKKLKMYRGAEHPHAAQSPVKAEL
jgi:large subunit ribosomal protein L13